MLTRACYWWQVPRVFDTPVRSVKNAPEPPVIHHIRRIELDATLVLMLLVKHDLLERVPDHTVSNDREDRFGRVICDSKRQTNFVILLTPSWVMRQVCPDHAQRRPVSPQDRPGLGIGLSPPPGRPPATSTATIAIEPVHNRMCSLRFEQHPSQPLSMPYCTSSFFIEQIQYGEDGPYHEIRILRRRIAGLLVKHFKYHSFIILLPESHSGITFSLYVNHKRCPMPGYQ